MLSRVLLLICTAAPSVIAATTSFVDKSLPVHESPYVLITADVNGDDKPDIVADLFGSISVYLNGDFSSPLNQHLPHPSQFMVAGDFNGDGKIDLVTLGTVIQVHLGNGDGTFQDGPTYKVTGLLGQAVTGDFNRDGKLDLTVTVFGGDNGLLTFPGNGAGTFGTPAYLPFNTSGTANRLTTADFNKDGIADLAVSVTFPNSIQIVLGNGDGTFRLANTINVPAFAEQMVTGDFNRDGKVDLAIATQTNQVAVMLGDGDGTFQPPVYYALPQTPSALAVADFNHDGFEDLAVTEGFSNATCLLLGKGDGTFQPVVTFSVSGSSQMSITVGDYNHDGRKDIAIGGLLSLSILYNTTH